MSRMILNEQNMMQAVYGSTLLAGGGGGLISQGLVIGKQAVEIGEPSMATIDEFSDDEIFVMVSAVGAASGENIFLKPSHFIKTIELIKASTEITIGGIITSEIGPINVVNGWIQSAVTGLPVIDAPADGRGHPTGEMGLMDILSDKGHISVQAASGGSKERGRYIELLVKGTIANCASTIREASIKAGGIVAVAREFVTAEYVKKNGCPGALSQTIELGKAFLEAQSKNIESVIKVIEENLCAELVDEGKIFSANCKAEKGMDIGFIEIETKTRHKYQIDVLDNFIFLENKGNRVATFPDLILLINKETGLPINGAEAPLLKGKEVLIFVKKKDELKLGSAYKNLEVFNVIEHVFKKDIKSYVG